MQKPNNRGPFANRDQALLREVAGLKDLIRRIPAPRQSAETLSMEAVNFYLPLHGFDVGDIVYWTGTSWAGAQNDDIDTAVFHGVVSFVQNDDVFDVAFSGLIESETSLGFTPGELYYVDSATDSTPITPCPDDAVIASPAFLCINDYTLLVFPCAAVQPPLAQDMLYTLTTVGTTNVSVPSGATQLTIIAICPGAAGAAAYGTGFFALSGAGGAAGAIAVMQCDASDITGDITVSINPTISELQFSFIYKGYGLYFTLYAGLTEPYMAYTGPDAPAVIITQGADGGAPYVTSANGTSMTTTPGAGAPGYALFGNGNLPAWGAGGVGGTSGGAAAGAGAGGFFGIIY